MEPKELLLGKDGGTRPRPRSQPDLKAREPHIDLAEVIGSIPIALVRDTITLPLDRRFRGPTPRSDGFLPGMAITCPRDHIVRVVGVASEQVFGTMGRWKRSRCRLQETVSMTLSMHSSTSPLTLSRRTPWPRTSSTCDGRSIGSKPSSSAACPAFIAPMEPRPMARGPPCP